MNDAGGSAASKAGLEPAGSRLGSLLGELGAFVLLGTLALLFFWRLLTPNPLDRAHIAWGDFGSQYYPLRLFAARELAQGRLPLWNPYLNGGQPALADAQSAVFYPPYRLLAALAPDGELPIAGLERYVVAHFVLAGIFTYLFARYTLRRHHRSIARLAALLAATTFTFGGYLTSFPVQQLTILEAGIWLPLLLLGLALALERRSLLVFALAGLPLTLSWLAGHAQTTMYVVYLAAAYLAVKASAGGRGWRDGKLIAGGILTFVLGTAMAAIQLLPTYEFFRLSTRVDLAYRDTSFGLPLPELVGLLLPGVFGGRTLYVGILALTLAVLAVALGRELPLGRFWQGVALAALLVSLGGNTFLYSILYLLGPGFAAVRDQERAVFLASFALSLLAGHGLAALIDPARPEEARMLPRLRRVLFWTGVGGLVLALSALYGQAVAPPQAAPVLGIAADRGIFAALMLLLAAGLLRLREKNELSRGTLAALAIFMIVLDLFTSGWQAHLVDAKEARGYGPSDVAETLAAQPGGTLRWRLSSEGLLPGGGSGAAVYALRDIVGNTPFQLKAYADANAALDEVQRSRLLAVGYWLTKRQLDQDGRFAKIGEFGEARLYELGPAVRLPRAYLAHEVLVVPDEFTLPRVAAVDLSRVVVLAESVAARQSVPPTAQPAGEVRQPQFVVDTPTRQALSVELSTPGVLVVSEVYYPGWRVFVDGEERPLLRVQHLLRGVALPPGRHYVEFRFASHTLQHGALVSAAAAALLLLLALGTGAPRLRRALLKRRAPA